MRRSARPIAMKHSGAKVRRALLNAGATANACVIPNACVHIAMGTVLITSLLSARLQAQPAKWTIDAKPQLAVGATGDGSTAEFAMVIGATRLADGNLLVVDRNDYSVLIVAPNGKVISKSARKGHGPGELTDAFFSWSCGKEIFVENDGGKSISVFTADARYVRSFRFGTNVKGQESGSKACNRNGSFVHIAPGFVKDSKPGVAYRAPVPVWITPGDSTNGRVIATVQGTEWQDNSQFPLGRETRVAIGTNRAYVGEANSYSIKVFSLDGKPLPTITKAAKAVAPSRQDSEDEIERVLAIVGPTDQNRKWFKDVFASMPLPKTLPPYRDMFVDKDENLWVRNYARTGTNVTWTVFNPAGKEVTEILLPNALEVFEAGKDYVLGRYIDPAAGVPEVRMYRLVKK
ncbi:MAG: hypothetical protein ABJB74_10135 [Gemmatimonas sp.]